MAGLRFDCDSNRAIGECDPGTPKMEDTMKSDIGTYKKMAKTGAMPNPMVRPRHSAHKNARCPIKDGEFGKTAPETRNTSMSYSTLLKPMAGSSCLSRAQQQQSSTT